MGVTSNQEQLVNFSPQPVSSSGSTPGTPNDPISITAANFLAAYQASPQTLIEGYYLITDQCEVGMLIQTAKDKRGIITPSLEALGFYDNPDFQDVGNYANLTIPKGTNWGVWYQGLELTTITYDTLAGGNFSPGDTITEPTNSAVGVCISDDGSTITLVRQTPLNFFVAGNSINNGLGVSANELVVTGPSNPIALGDIVFWNGFHFQLVDDTTIDGTDPYTNTTAYLRLVKGSNANLGYIRCEAKVEYDFRNNWIQAYTDERGIVIRDTFLNSNGSIDLFQRGNDFVFGQSVPDGSIYTNINNRGIITSNLISSSSLVISDNTNTGTITGNSFINSSIIANKTSQTLGSCTFIGIIATVNPLISETSYIAEKGVQSTFPCTIDITGLTTLDITAANNYCGVINITGGAVEGIDTITNRPQVPFKLNFPVITTFTITGTAAVAMMANKIALSAATYVGNGSKGDFIEFEEATLNSVLCSKEIQSINII